MAEVEEQQFDNYEDQPQENVEEMVEEVETDGLLYGTTAEMPEIKLFGRWSCDDVNVSDMSLAVSILMLFSSSSSSCVFETSHRVKLNFNL